MKEIEIYVDFKTVDISQIERYMSDDEIDDGIYSSQTVIDMRDALIYLRGRSEAMERLYRYSVTPPKTGQQVDELLRLKEWFSTEA